MRSKIYFKTAVVLSLFVFNNIVSADSPSKVENFSLKDYNEKIYKLNDFKNSKAIVIMFIATQCPVSNGYNTRMAKLYDDYKSKGVTFLGINSNKQETVEEIKNHAKEQNLNFIILKDLNNVIADKFGASVTPEIFVLNNQYEILYHGRIDDSRRENDVKRNDLRIALDEILAGKKVSEPVSKAFGCSIKRVN